MMAEQRTPKTSSSSSVISSISSSTPSSLDQNQNIVPNPPASPDVSIFYDRIFLGVRHPIATFLRIEPKIDCCFFLTSGIVVVAKLTRSGIEFLNGLGQSFVLKQKELSVVKSSPHETPMLTTADNLQKTFRALAQLVPQLFEPAENQQYPSLVCNKESTSLLWDSHDLRNFTLMENLGKFNDFFFRLNPDDNNKKEAEIHYDKGGASFQLIAENNQICLTTALHYIYCDGNSVNFRFSKGMLARLDDMGNILREI